jgi:2-iminobutanoate/2-iminopropanoate deaminase
MRIIHTPQAPSAIGPYCQAIVHDGLVYASGQIGWSPDKEWGEGVAGEARQALENLSHVLEAAGSSLGRALKVTVYLKDMNDFGEINAVYAEFFGDHRPARACVEAARLPKDAQIEIDCIAAVN